MGPGCLPVHMFIYPCNHLLPWSLNPTSPDSSLEASLQLETPPGLKAWENIAPGIIQGTQTAPMCLATCQAIVDYNPTTNK